MVVRRGTHAMCAPVAAMRSRTSTSTGRPIESGSNHDPTRCSSACSTSQFVGGSACPRYDAPRRGGPVAAMDPGPGMTPRPCTMEAPSPEAVSTSVSRCQGNQRSSCPR
jgi:hypothetical protein